MNLLDFLGLGAPKGQDGSSGLFSMVYGDGSPARTGPQQPSQGIGAFLGDPQSQAAPAFQPIQRPHGLHGILDRIGDALLTANGAEPIHRQHFEEAQQQQALSGFLTDPDTAISRLAQINAPLAIKLYQTVHPPSEHTMEQKVYEYWKGLPPEERPAFEKSIQLTHPGMGTPITAEAGTQYQDQNGNVTTLGGASGEVTATGPGGQKLRLNPQTRQWEPVGGQTPPASGNFPGR